MRGLTSGSAHGSPARCARQARATPSIGTACTPWDRATAFTCMSSGPKPLIRILILVHLGDSTHPATTTAFTCAVFGKKA